jgi:hypothetical protein
MEKNYLNSIDEFNELKNIISYINGYYSDFWKKISNNVTYKYYKEAIQTLKGNQQLENNEFILNTHSFINKRLYTGKCEIKKPKTLKKLGYNVSSDKLCQFIIDTINYFDEAIFMAPKIDVNLTVFRMSGRTDIINLSTGTFFIERNYTATSLNPGIPFNFFDPDASNLYFEIIIPKNTPGFYYNVPYQYAKNSNVEENEFILPRDSIYYIVDKKNINVFGFKIIKFTLLYVTTKKSKEKLKNYSETLDSSIVKHSIKNLIIPKLFRTNYMSKVCFIFFNFCKIIHRKKLEFNKISTNIKNNDGFKKASRDIKVYKGYTNFKKIKINDKYKPADKLTTSYIFINALKIFSLEELMGDPYSKSKYNKFIIEYTLKKGTLYKAVKKKKNLSINTTLIINKTVKFRVKKINDLIDRDLNKITFIQMESI